MVCVCSSLCYGWTKFDVECLQGKGNGRNIICYWRYRVKYWYTTTHFHPRPYFGVGVQHKVPTILPPEKETRYQILQNDGWAKGAVLMGVGKRILLTPTGVLTPNHPFRSQSLSRKQESFCPVVHTHRPTTLSVISRH